MIEFLKHKLYLFPVCNLMAYWWEKSHAVCTDQAHLLTDSTSHPGTVCKNGILTINNKKDDILSTCAGFQHNIQIEPANSVLRCALLIQIHFAVWLAAVFSLITDLFGITLHELQICNFIRKCGLVIYTRPNAFFSADQLFTPQ